MRICFSCLVSVLRSGAKRWFQAFSRATKRSALLVLSPLLLLLLLTSFTLTILYRRIRPPLSLDDQKSFWPLTVLPDLDPVDDSSKLLVSFDAESACDGRRLGNQLFTVSALLYAAQLTGRTAVLPDRDMWTCMSEFSEHFVRESSDSRGGHNDGVAVISYSRRFKESTQSTVICPCFRFTERLPMAYDEQIAKLSDMANSASNRTLLMFGYFQSWRYVDPVADSVRRALIFAPEVGQAAAKYLAAAMPPFPPPTSSGVDRRLVRVGIHVRRGDMASIPVHIIDGYKPPGAEFYRRAIDFFVERHSRVQFVACSDEMDWTQQNIRAPKNTTSLADGE